MQRIQTDRGREFFAVKVQEKLMKLSIKFRPNKPGSPHLNGKVERSQKTNLEEFYATADLSHFENLKEQLGYWEFFYNWYTLHAIEVSVLVVRTFVKLRQMLAAHKELRHKLIELERK